MSIRHSDKCSKEVAQQFLVKVKKWCDENKIPYKTIRGLTAYEGEVRIYNGLYTIRGSRKRVRQHDEVGYFLSKTVIREPMYTSIFRDEWNDKRYRKDEQEAIKDFFRKEI